MMVARLPDPEPFYNLVWEIVQQIPEGRVSTYGQIAVMIPPPEGVSPDTYRRWRAQWVGHAMRAAPAGRGIPWQRVINSQGGISLPAGSAAADEQRGRLEMEGVAFDASGRVDFAEVGWEGPDEAWLEARGLFAPPSLAPGRRDPPSDQLSLL